MRIKQTNQIEKNQIGNYSFFCYERKGKEFIKNNKLILKSGSHKKFTKEINNINLSSNDNKRMHSIDSIHTYAYGTSKDQLSEEENKSNNIKNKTKCD